MRKPKSSSPSATWSPTSPARAELISAARKSTPERADSTRVCLFFAHLPESRTLPPPMHSPDNIQYALETTRVLLEPDRRIDTFGDTRFEFQLLSELMDR